MKEFFSMNNRFMQSLSKVADLMILNLLFILCSLPIFTIGASLTALYSVTLKLVRNEEGYIVSAFFKAWKKNFKISTIIWLGLVVIGGIIFVDFRVIPQMFQEMSLVLRIMLGVLSVCYVLILNMVFPYIARFENTVKETIWNAFLIGILNFYYILLVLLTVIVPVILTFILDVQFFALAWILFFFAETAYITSMIYRKIFDKYETTELSSC